MNKQIRQLLLEAQDLARAEVKRTPELAKYAPSYAIPGTEIHVELGLSYEKFAELIVRECAELFVDQKYMILNPHEPFANERVRALKEHDKDTVKKIKRHFGVEE